MSIGREESLFLTVSEDHRQRAYPEYVQRMSAPFSRAGGMVAAYEGVLLGGADKRFGLDELNLWLRRGPVALAAQYGGFCILDEINMAKNDAVAVLHSALDYRRLIDVPGYECIPIHPAARFIATMNYGYAGTRELNEALVSRFTVIRMPTLEEAQLCELLRANVPEASDENIKRCTGLFLDLNVKAVNGEISTNSVDMRGMIAALHLMTDGMAPKDAIAVSITNKCFDEYEYALVRDVALTRFV